MTEAGSMEALHKKTAAQCNNAAWALVEQPTLDGAERGELVRLAATASYHWNSVGTPNQVAHADVLFSWALARADAGPAAVAAASRALTHFTEHPSENWELAFAHAAMAAAFHCDGQPDGHRQHHQAAKELAARLGPEDLKLFEAAFKTVPPP